MQQIANLDSFLPGLEQTPIVQVVDKPAWLGVWECDTWPEGRPDQVVTYLMVYRSPLVKDTSAIYGCVMSRLLEADHAEVVRTADCEDPLMMFGAAEAMLLRVYQEGVEPLYRADEIKSIIDDMERAML